MFFDSLWTNCDGLDTFIDFSNVTSLFDNWASTITGSLWWYEGEMISEAFVDKFCLL